jgi:dolichol-phosphate mannosyltransferase
VLVNDDVSIEFSLVVPTYEERGTIAAVLRDVAAALGARAYEVIVVDDASPDGTLDVVRTLASGDHRIRAVERTSRPRDLARSVVEGFGHARGRILASMNGDGSHDPAVLVSLWDAVRNGADVAIASRYVDGARLLGWPARRRALSAVATWTARRATGVGAHDPLSGCYAFRRDVFTAVEAALRPRGFKILLEIIARARPDRVVEVPIAFRDRTAGSSKLSWKVAAFGLVSLLRLLTTRRPRPSYVDDPRPRAGIRG